MHCFPGAGKMISSHTVTKTALIQMPGVVAQLPREFGFNEDNGFRMKDWAGRISALGTLNALPESHRKLGGSASFQWRTCPSHKTTLGTARTRRWWWKRWREAKDTRLWARSRASTSKAFMRCPRLSQSPQGEPGDLPFPFLLARAVEGKWECLGKWRVNRGSGFRDGLRWGNGGSERWSDRPPSNENERELGQEPRSPGPWFHNTTSRKEHSAFGCMSTLVVLQGSL